MNRRRFNGVLNSYDIILELWVLLPYRKGKREERNLGLKVGLPDVRDSRFIIDDIKFYIRYNV